MEEPKIYLGHTRWWNNARGFGFVREDGSDVDYFVHHSSVIAVEEDGNGRPWYGLEDGSPVSFEAKMGKRGTMVAFNVQAFLKEE